MINRADISTSRAAAPNARYTTPSLNLSAALTVMHRSLKALPDSADNPLASTAHQPSRGAAKKFLLASTAQVYAADVHKPDSTAVDTAALASEIAAATHAGGNKSSGPLLVSDASTQTPLQRLLLKAVYELTPAVLAGKPALLAAVRAGFQAEGGRQLAFAANILDASLVGDISQPVATVGPAPVHGRRLVGDSSKLAGLVLYGATVIKPGATPSAPPWPVLTEPNAADLVAKTFTFNSNFAKPQVEEITTMLTAIAENSATMRNVLVMADLNVKLPIKIVVKPSMWGNASIKVREDGTSFIFLKSVNDVKVAARNIVFEANNASTITKFRSHRIESSFASSAQLPQPQNSLEAIAVEATRIYQGGVRHDMELLNKYVNARWMQRDTIDKCKIFFDENKSIIDMRVYTAKYTEFKGNLTADLRREALHNFDAVKKFVTDTYTPRQLTLANNFATERELLEDFSAVNHNKIFTEIDTARENGKLTPGSEGLLNQSSIENMDLFRGDMNFSPLERLNVQIDGGHTGVYWFEYRHPRAIAVLPREGGTQADVSLEEAGASAGQNARNTINMAISSDAAVATDGSVQAAARVALHAESMTLAQKIMSSPEVVSGLKAIGKVLTVAAIAAMVYQLGEAIKTDAANGDREAHSTRKVLTELLGGLAAGEAGALGGAAAGALIGSAVPVVGTTVGAFVGGLFGGLLGFAVGSAAGSAAYGFTQKPIDALIDGLIANKARSSPGNQRSKAVFNARLKLTGDDSASTSYAQTTSRLGMSEAASLAFASILTPAEASDARFMAALAGRLGHTSQDLPASLGFARSVTAFGIAKDSAIYFSATVTSQEENSTGFMNTLADAAQMMTPADALARTRLTMHQRAITLAPTQAPVIDKNLAFGQRLVQLGSKNDLQVNHSEFRDGLQASGLDISALGAQQTDMLIAAYDADGNGALSAQEIAAALATGALVVIGSSVGINVHAAITTLADARAFPTTGTLPDQGNPNYAANTAQRVVSAGSSNDAYANHTELREGFKAAGYVDVQGSNDELDAVIASYGSGNGALNNEQLARAIADGALTLQDDGSVRVRFLIRPTLSVGDSNGVATLP